MTNFCLKRWWTDFIAFWIHSPCFIEKRLFCSCNWWKLAWMKHRSLAFHLKLGLQQIFSPHDEEENFQPFQLPTIDWTLETKPRRDKMSDLPFSIKNILSGNIGKKEHLQWHFCPIFSRCPWTYVPRIQLSSPSSKKMKKVKRSVFSKDQIAKLEKSFQKTGKGSFPKRRSVLLAIGINSDHLQRRPS